MTNFLRWYYRIDIIHIFHILGLVASFGDSSLFLLRAFTGSSLDWLLSASLLSLSVAALFRDLVAVFLVPFPFLLLELDFVVPLALGGAFFVVLRACDGMEINAGNKCRVVILLVVNLYSDFHLFLFLFYFILLEWYVIIIIIIISLSPA